jgi:hypothetical protein
VPHPALPQVKSLGGRVLTSPKVVVVTYDGDPQRGLLEAFPSALGKSAYWPAVTAEYGVGPITASPHPVHIADAPPAAIDDIAVQAWLEAQLDGTHVEWDPPDGETLYEINYPAGTTYTLAGWTGCKEFGAQDGTLLRKDGSRVPYIVIPRCPPMASLGLDPDQTLTYVMSHELAEESTDPFKDAYVTNDDDHLAWSFEPPFSEIADMCIADPRSPITPPDLGYVVQRVWSNAAASAGKNPCVPAPASSTYFNALPVLTEDVPIAYAKFGWAATTKGVTVAVGETKTIDVALFSEAETDAWQVFAYDAAALEGRPAELELHLDAPTGRNGDVRKLTITALRAGTDGGSRFAIFCKHGVDDAFSIGYVAN